MQSLGCIVQIFTGLTEKPARWRVFLFLFRLRQFLSARSVGGDQDVGRGYF